VRLDESECGFFVVEMGGGQNGLSHDEISYGSNLYLGDGVVKCNVALRKQLRTKHESCSVATDALTD
jgi:hypothetical protein